MNDFDDKLHALLSAEDKAFITSNLDETGYHKEVLNSFKGEGSALPIGVWIGIFIFCAILFFGIWQFFQAETIRDQIMYASLTIMANSAQISLKLWFNQRLNRRAVIMEIRKLRLALTHDKAS